MHPAIGQAVRLHFQHYALQCAVLAAGLAQNLQITGVAGLTDTRMPSIRATAATAGFTRPLRARFASDSSANSRWVCL